MIQAQRQQVIETTRFQFHKGSIDTIIDCISYIRHLSFNSIKVRLIPDAQRVAVELATFQFHKGSIDTQGMHVYTYELLVSIP